jgi:hypothetical protein
VARSRPGISPGPWRLRAQLHLAVLHEVLVDEHVQDAGVGEVEQRGQEGGALRRLFAARGQHGQRGAQHGAADTEAQRVEVFARR